MKRKRFTEEQIITILKEHEAGSTVVDLARHHGVAENTIYRWKSKYGGMEVSDAKRLRALESENAKLKRMSRVRKPQKLPQVLSVEEVERLLASASNPKHRAALAVA